MSVIQTMYSKARTAVKLGSGESGEFEVRVGVHQGSVLSGIKGKRKPDPNFQCKICSSGIQDLPIVDHKKMDMDMDGDGILEMVQQFCYLGDMIGAGGGTEEAVRCRIR